MSAGSWKNEFEGHRILIWGYGREGKASVEFIHRICPDLKPVICDESEKALASARNNHPYAEVKPQQEVDFSAFDLILKAPGIVVGGDVDRTHLTGETQLFLKHYADHTIGVTGTKGKSTTTSLVYAMMKEEKPVHLVGNIGTPCFEAIDGMEKGDYAAFEISCHQLEFCPYSPHVAVFLNLYPEHLDHYGTFEAYGRAKANIYRHQKAGDILIADPSIPGIEEERPDLIRIGSDVRAEGKTLIIPGKTLDASGCALLGEHNYQNAAAAFVAVQTLGISDQSVLHALNTFHPLAHRLEDLGEKDGIRYINDSISTIGQATIKALETLPEVNTVLIGGMDRGIPYGELEDCLMAHPSLHVILMYASGKRIYQELQQKNANMDRVILVDDLAEAVAAARKMTAKGMICLLSPAAASYDHFKNFEERGDAFRKLTVGG